MKYNASGGLGQTRKPMNSQVSSLGTSVRPKGEIVDNNKSVLMPSKHDQDTTPGVRLLRMFRKLMLDGRRHFQLDLAAEYQCSPQTIIRMAGEIEAVIGTSLESGLENRR
ncbi:MAG: hypothetical protein LBH65_04510, partial [Desulfovibrio sp.]|nr:hypothetical protein [Desulfovibrio sp.]